MQYNATWKHMYMYIHTLRTFWLSSGSSRTSKLSVLTCSFSSSMSAMEAKSERFSLDSNGTGKSLREREGGREEKRGRGGGEEEREGGGREGGREERKGGGREERKGGRGGREERKRGRGEGR